jgi:hypothetical protein
MPGPISGYSSVCRSQTKSYSVSAVSGATSYNWTVTGGAVIYSGQGNRNVSIRFNSASATTATVSVTTSNACGTSQPRTFTVNVNLNCKVSAEETAGINTGDASEMLSVFPNPTTGKSTLSLYAVKDANYSLKVVDMIGRVMIHEDIAMPEGYNTRELNLEGFARGLYLVSIQTEGSEAKVIRLIVE